FKNISDATGTVAFGAASSITGNVTAATLDETGYGWNLTVTITGANAGTATDIGGSFSCVSAIDANAAKSNTMGGTGQTYTLDAVVADKASPTRRSSDLFKNISDATGTVAFGAASSITGNVTAATLNETGYGSNLTVTLTGANAGTATDIGGSFSGVSAIDANAAKSRTVEDTCEL